MSFTLTLNDDLTATLRRYNYLIKGKRPEPFLAGGKLPWVVDENAPSPELKHSGKKKKPSPKKEEHLPMKSVSKVVNFEEFSNETKEMKRDDFMNFDNP